MAAPGPNLPPIRVEYPPNTYKRDALTARGTGQPYTFLPAAQGVFNACVTGPLPVNPQLSPVRFANMNGLVCYRNAALSVLMHTKAFVNFLANLNNVDQRLSMLEQISNAYWNTAQSDIVRSANATSLVNPWFNMVRQYNDHTGFVSWTAWLATSGQADSVEFLEYVLNLAEHTLNMNA